VRTHRTPCLVKLEAHAPLRVVHPFGHGIAPAAQGLDCYGPITSMTGLQLAQPLEDVTGASAGLPKSGNSSSGSPAVATEHAPAWPTSVKDRPSPLRPDAANANVAPRQAAVAASRQASLPHSTRLVVCAQRMRTATPKPDNCLVHTTSSRAPCAGARSPAPPLRDQSRLRLDASFQAHGHDEGQPIAVTSRELDVSVRFKADAGELAVLQPMHLESRLVYESGLPVAAAKSMSRLFCYAQASRPRGYQKNWG